VNALSPVDLLQIAASGLKPGHKYTLWLVASRTPPFGPKEALVTFNTNVAGAQVTQATGPLRLVLGGAGEDAAEQGKERLLSLTQTGSDKPGAHPESEKTP
jgi:hypothetical protein